MRQFFQLLLVFQGLSLFPVAAVNAGDPTDEKAEFFEKKIRPILSENCFECHGTDKQESDLRLDSRAAILKGGASGPAASLETPEDSLIIKVLNYDGDVEMPPDQKLDAEIVNDIQKWIKDGMVWPKSESNENVAPVSMEDRVRNHQKKHWSYQPIQRPQIPVIEDDAWSMNEIDRLVLKKLRQQSLAPSPQANQIILIKRLYADLLGIPPTLEEVRNIQSDKSPDWYETLVDRLIASPRYGERWGRHWLDVARYADTRGYAFAKDRNYPHAYTYRDYVIRSFNEDKPYRQFVLEQLAADLIDLGDDLRPLAALGFLTVGRKFNNIHDDIDDKIDVLSRGLMGLTISCARCHDHKYDAIPTEDYYSLYGVMASNSEGDLPYIGSRKQVADFEKNRAEIKLKQQQLDQFLQKQIQEISEQARTNTTSYLVHALVRDQGYSSAPFEVLPLERLDKSLMRSWRIYLRRHAKKGHRFWGVWIQLSELNDEKSFPDQVKSAIAAWERTGAAVNPLLMAELKRQPPKSRVEIARIYGKLLSSVYQEWKKQGSRKNGLDKLSNDQQEIGSVLFADDSPTKIKLEKVKDLLAGKARDEHLRLEAELREVKSHQSRELDRAMVVREKSRPFDPYVFIRGQAGRRGKKIPRRFVHVLSSPDRKPFQTKSGRGELANAIVDNRNPLTARVIANRVWMHLLGQPIVATPSDFGKRAPVPVQADVLDLLSSTLMNQEWSIKSLQRQILLSATYRQSSLHRTDAANVDPENHLFWKVKRKRLEFEPLRDAMLLVSNQLDMRMGGKSVEITKSPFARRRAVYGYIDRQDLPNLLRAFDFASPDQSTARRTETTVPQQLLFMMNSPFVLECSTLIADGIPSELPPRDRIRLLYEKILARGPSNAEMEIAFRYWQSQTGTTNLMRNLAQMLLLTNEFCFVD